MGKVNMDKVKNRQAELAKGGSDKDFWQPADGRNVIRVLPPAEGKDVFWSEGFIHFGVGPESRMVTCSKDKYGKCPVCKFIEEIADSKNKEEKELAKKMKRKKRVYMNILVRDEDADPKKVQVLQCGPTIFKGILDIFIDEDFGDIVDLKEGRDIIITRSGKKLNTEYSVQAKPKTSKAFEVKVKSDELEEMLVDLDSLFKDQSPQKLTAILEGEDEEDEDEGGKAKKNGKKDKDKKASKKRREEEEEDEEEEDEEPDDDDDEEDEEDEEDEDDEEDEEEEEEEEDEDDEEEDDDEDEKSGKSSGKSGKSPGKSGKGSSKLDSYKKELESKLNKSSKTSSKKSGKKK